MGMVCMVVRVLGHTVLVAAHAPPVKSSSPSHVSARTPAK
jgi:hypothetical protein